MAGLPFTNPVNGPLCWPLSSESFEFEINKVSGERCIIDLQLNNSFSGDTRYTVYNNTEGDILLFNSSNDTSISFTRTENKKFKIFGQSNLDQLEAFIFQGAIDCTTLNNLNKLENLKILSFSNGGFFDPPQASGDFDGVFVPDSLEEFTYLCEQDGLRFVNCANIYTDNLKKLALRGVIISDIWDELPVGNTIEQISIRDNISVDSSVGTLTPLSAPNVGENLISFITGSSATNLNFNVNTIADNSPNLETLSCRATNGVSGDTKTVLLSCRNLRDLKTIPPGDLDGTIGSGEEVVDGTQGEPVMPPNLEVHWWDINDVGKFYTDWTNAENLTDARGGVGSTQNQPTMDNVESVFSGMKSALTSGINLSNAVYRFGADITSVRYLRYPLSYTTYNSVTTEVNAPTFFWDGTPPLEITSWDDSNDEVEVNDPDQLLFDLINSPPDRPYFVFYGYNGDLKNDTQVLQPGDVNTISHSSGTTTITLNVSLNTLDSTLDSNATVAFFG